MDALVVLCVFCLGIRSLVVKPLGPPSHVYLFDEDNWYSGNRTASTEISIGLRRVSTNDKYVFPVVSQEGQIFIIMTREDLSQDEKHLHKYFEILKKLEVVEESLER